MAQRRARSRLFQAFAPILCVALLGGLLSPARATIDRGWLGDGANPVRVLNAVAEHSAKLPPEFHDRLQNVLADGTIRVIVGLTSRDAAIESYIGANSSDLHWYGAGPRFFASVTQDQLAALLEASFVAFLTPDYQLSYLLGGSVPDVNARKGAGPEGAPGVWSFDPAGGPRGALRSEVPGLSADQATGKDVTVAVVDGGIDKTHRDFGGWDCEAAEFTPCQSRVLRSPATEAWGFRVGSTDGPNTNDTEDLPTTDLAGGHGTHVAGIIAGNGYYVRDYAVQDPSLAEPDIYGGDGFPIGVAPQANLISVKNGELISAAFSLSALQWVLDNAAKYDIRVVNNSWGCLTGCAAEPQTSAQNQLVKKLYDAGVTVVFAAGNAGGGANGAGFAGGAQSPYSLAVANYDHSTHQLASNSSRGSSAAPQPDPATWTPESELAEAPLGYRRPDVAAPGTSVWAARSLTGGAASGVPRQNSADVTGGFGCCIREYATMSGTSMAAPHVSGAAALLFSACPAATPLDGMRAIMAAADADRVFKTGSTTVAQPFEVGYGGLDVRAALDWLMAQPVCGGSTNTAPVASDDSVSLNQGGTATVDVLVNDTDADGDPLTVLSTTEAASGSVSLVENVVTYAPGADFHGPDSFSYVVSDGNGGTDTGLVTIDVNGRPIATDDSVLTNQGAAVTFSAIANDSDPEGDVFSITDTTTPAHGTVSVGPSGITYTPEAGFHGIDTFEYEITDSGGASDTGIVTVDVNGTPVATDDSATTKKKTAVRINVLGNDSDPEGNALTVSSATQGANGSVDCSPSGTCTYIPSGDFKGLDTFTYTVCDARGACDQGAVRITVR